jgi:regulator of sigma E protease
MLFYQTLMVALMIFGFGFVVFFHELGHFLAAKWVGIKVEQFAVGFGQALFAWRKGIGWKVGTTQKEYLRRIEEHLASTSDAAAELQSKDKPEWSDGEIARAADELGLGETEYRLNWIPLGGYVKMLGQDDLKPNAVADDPRAYNRKGVGQRMIVVSAGVIMNIILAAIGFMVVFLIGFNAPAPIVGKVLPRSPADKGGIQVGDKILSIDGTPQYDFNRIVLSTALLKENRDVPVEVERRRPDGTTQRLTLQIRPARMDDDPKSFLAIGVGPGLQLRGFDAPSGSSEAADLAEAEKLASEPGRLLPEFTIIKPGDTIVAIEGRAVADPKYDYAMLYDALQRSGGKPVAIIIKAKDGSTREALVTPHIDRPFGTEPLSIAGMEPRPQVDEVPAKSSSAGKLMAGDVIVNVTLNDRAEDPDQKIVRELAGRAGEEGKKISATVIRGGQRVELKDLEAKTRIEKGRGLGIGLGYSSTSAVSRVLDNSPAKRAGIPDGAEITAVDEKPVDNWFAVRGLLAAAPGSHKITARAPGAGQAAKDYTLELSAADVDGLSHSLRATSYLALHDLSEIRKTSKPFEALSWGVVETRDFILQFYVTLTRMFQGSVSYTNMMGPVGIVSAGARFAFKGLDWLIWFLAMISANLAVVNFLPIPIVDGGLFTFLLLEKIQGKPLSPRAQAVAQIVGFAVIISVFLLVTFQDIKRTMGM